MTARACAGLVVLFVVYALIPLDSARWWIGALIGGVAIVATTPIALHRAREVRRSDWPVLDAVDAIVLVAALLVVSFSAVYVALSHQGDHFDGLETRIDAIYFTMATFSTVGFGDITATSQSARVIVVIQIVAGFLLIGVGIRALIAAARLRTSERRRAGGPLDDSHEHL